MHFASHQPAGFLGKASFQSATSHAMLWKTIFTDGRLSQACSQMKRITICRHVPPSRDCSSNLGGGTNA